MLVSRSVSAPSYNHRIERGATAIEWLIASGVWILMAALALDAGWWQITRLRTNIALMEAARAASVQYANPHVIERAFARQFRNSRNTAWRVIRIAPEEHAFMRGHDPNVKIPGAEGRRVLRHRPALDTPRATSRPAITLTLQAEVMHPVLSPVLTAVLRAASVGCGNGERCKAWRSGRLFITSRLSIEMQSHAVLWD